MIQRRQIVAPMEVALRRVVPGALILRVVTPSQARVVHLLRLVLHPPVQNASKK